MAKKRNIKKDQAEFEKLIGAIKNINPLEYRERTEKYKKIQIVLISLYTIATIVIAIVAFVQLPIIAESLKRPEILVRVSPYIEIDPYDRTEYIPIEVMNIGNGPATNLTVKIKSCYGKIPMPYRIGILNPDQKYKIHFKHEKTLENFKKIDCQSLSGFNISDYWIEIMTYRNIRNNEILAPTISKTLDVCGDCFWEIYIIMDQGEFEDKIPTYSPIQLVFNLKGDVFNISDPDIVPYSSINVSIFGAEFIEKLTAGE